MSVEDTDARRLRLADAEAADEAASAPRQAPAPGAAILCRTATAGSYPTVAAAYYSVTPQSVLGTEAEGTSGVLANGPTPFFALNIGTHVPSPGSQVLVFFVPNRWVFRYDG